MFLTAGTALALAMKALGKVDMAIVYHAVCVGAFAAAAAAMLPGSKVVLAKHFPGVAADDSDSVRDEALRGLKSLGLGAAVCCVQTMVALAEPGQEKKTAYVLVIAQSVNEIKRLLPTCTVPFAPCHQVIQAVFIFAWTSMYVKQIPELSASMGAVGAFVCEGMYRLLHPAQVVATWPLTLKAGRDPGPAYHYAMCCGVFYLAIAAGILATIVHSDTVAVPTFMMSVLALLELYGAIFGSIAGTLEFQPSSPYLLYATCALAVMGWGILFLRSKAKTAKKAKKA